MEAYLSREVKTNRLFNAQPSMNILLTGATGFLGSYLLKKLLQTSDHQITILKRSTSNVFRITNEINSLEFLDADTKNLKELIDSREKGFDCIIHCATDFGRKKSNFSTHTGNIMGNMQKSQSMTHAHYTFALSTLV